MKKRSHARFSRRLFLGGAGVAIALPALRSVLPASARADCTAPKRFLGYYVPCGIHMPAWTPSGSGTDWELTPILESLTMVKNDVNILTGLANRPARPDGPGDHASGTGAFLTAAHPYKTEGSDIRNGISLDQVIANEIGDCTDFASVELGIDGGSSAGGCDSGYSCAYARNISWTGPATPLPKVVNPQVHFDRMFAGFDSTETSEAMMRRRLYQTSVLDYALEQATSLRARLGKSDRYKLDEYLNAIRDVEMRINAMSSGPVCTVPDRPGDVDFREHVDVMQRMMILAFQCDLTRVQTFMLGNAGSGRVYDFLGISQGHHEISHHMSDPSNFAKLQTIDTWEVSQFARLLEGLKAVEDIDGQPMLDNCAVFFSSEIEDGNSHSHFNMPIILAGKGGGAWTTGRHIVFSETRDANPPVANLFVTIANACDTPITSFGDDSTGPLSLA